MNDLLCQPSEFIELKGGLIVPVEVIRLRCELEDRGFTVTEVQGNLRIPSVKDTNGTIRDSLSESDKDRIRKWKVHLLAVLAYEPPPIP